MRTSTQPGARGVDPVHRGGARSLLRYLEAGEEQERAPGRAVRMTNARRFFGPAPRGRGSRIMVTPGGSEADDPALVARLVAAGMDLLRINCAFGNPEKWARSAENLRLARKRAGRSCALFLDLAGPKLRTGRIHGNARLAAGSRFLLVDEAERRSRTTTLVEVNLPAVLRRLRVGERIWLDDGRFNCRVRRAGSAGIELECTFALGGERTLLSGKSINIPGTDLRLPALTDKDLRDLRHAASIADCIGLSYVHSPDDIAELQGWLRILGRSDAGLVVKIENRDAFLRAPEILLQAMRSRNVALLVARGDLTVEAGAEWLAAMQVRLLQLGRAARIPTIVATGILATLVETGMPAHAEIIDAVAAREADCVMVHGGPHVLEAVRFLGQLQRHGQSLIGSNRER